MKNRFTLSELAIVISGLAVISSLINPASMRALDDAKRAQCAANICRGISAMQCYSESYGGWVGLNSDGKYSWWSVPTMPNELGLDTSDPDYKRPGKRPGTFCPSGPVQDHAWYTIICYGTPRLSGESASDYAEYRFERIGYKPHWEHVKISLIPDPGKYVILADAGYGPRFPLEATSEDPRIAGGHVSVFYRRNSDFSAICMRHNGVGNVGYADGHVGTTADRSAIWQDSKIGSLVTSDGTVLESFFE